MGKLWDAMNKDRGGTNFNKIFSKIPVTFYEKAGFVLTTLMFGGLLVEEFSNVFLRSSIYQTIYYTVGALGVVSAILYVAFCLKGGKDHKLQATAFLKQHIWDLALTLMLIWSFVCALLAQDRDTALYGAPMRHDGFDSYMIYAGMYISAKAVKNEKKRWCLLRSFVLTASLLSIMSLFQANTELILEMGQIGDNLGTFCETYAAVFLNTNHFGYFLTLALMAAAGLVVFEKNLLHKGMFLVLFGFNLWALLINDTFGCYLAVTFGVLFLAVMALIRDKKLYKEVIAVLLVLVIMSLLMNQNSLISNNFHIAYNDSKTMNQNDAGGSGRIGLWKETIKCIKEKPVFGFGPEGLRERFLFEKEFGNDRPHNEYLQHAAFLGIPGLLFYLTALVSLFVYCLKNLKKLSLPFLVAGGMVFGYCVSAFFGNTIYYTAVYYFMCLGLLSSCREQEEAGCES